MHPTKPQQLTEQFDNLENEVRQMRERNRNSTSNLKEEDTVTVINGQWLLFIQPGEAAVVRYLVRQHRASTELHACWRHRYGICILKALTYDPMGRGGLLVTYCHGAMRVRMSFLCIVWLYHYII